MSVRISERAVRCARYDKNIQNNSFLLSTEKQGNICHGFLIANEHRQPTILKNRFLG